MHVVDALHAQGLLQAHAHHTHTHYTHMHPHLKKSFDTFLVILLPQ